MSSAMLSSSSLLSQKQLLIIQKLILLHSLIHCDILSEFASFVYGQLQDGVGP